MNCPNCGAQMQPGPIRGQKRCRYCETIVDERPLKRETPGPAGPFSLLADRDADGTPDIFQVATSMSRTEVQTSYEINGKRYASLEEVPAEYRELLSTVDTAPEVVVEIEPEVVASLKTAPQVAAQRVERTESHLAWPRRELERADFGKPGARSAWVKPFVLGMLAALLLGWLLFG